MGVRRRVAKILNMAGHCCAPLGIPRGTVIPRVSWVVLQQILHLSSEYWSSRKLLLGVLLEGDMWSFLKREYPKNPADKWGL